MTTIAWDGKTLASDSQTSCSYIRQGGVNKIFKRKDKAFAGAGSSVEIANFINGTGKLSAGDVVYEVDLKSGVCIEHFDTGSEKVSPPVAQGSGKDFAMGAMLSGATAIRAVKTAKKLDPYTGGKIQSVRIK